MKRMLLLPLALVATLVVAAQPELTRRQSRSSRAGFHADRDDGHRRRLGHVAQRGHGEPPGRRERRLVRVAGAEGRGDVHVHLPKAGRSPTTTRSSRVAQGHRDRQARRRANVTLTAATPIVYGDSTTVSGAVTNQLTNEPVTLTSQPYGKGTQSLATTTTTANGAFSFDVSPTIQTSYQAHWRTQGARRSR